jgi:carbamoyltransferase
MVITYNVTPEFKKNSPAVVHVDGTVRPQVVFKEDNSFLYDLLNHWHTKTGGLCLINTSYNLHENPIASLERDVVSSFESNATDHLLFPPYIAHQRGKE